MTSPTRVLGVDLDDVVIDFNSAFCEWHNRYYGTSYKRKDIVSYGLENICKCTPDEVHQRVFDFYHTDEHRTAPPVQGAIEGLHELKKKNVLIAATSRPEVVRNLTLEWLHEQSLEVFDSLHFLGHYHGPVERKISKAKICEEVGAELFIEDSLAHATSIARTGVPVLLFDTPWNQGFVSALITRVFSWEEILQRTSDL
jgi:uncharacterized protein